jgi:hypothetical protein
MARPLVYSRFVGAFLLPGERRALEELARRDSQSISETIRRLIQQEAERRLQGGEGDDAA